MRFPVEALPQALAAIVLAALIGALLRAGRGRPENRALALFFGATLGFNTSVVLALSQTDSGAREMWSRLVIAFGMVDALFLIRFAAIYLRPQRPSGAWDRNPWLYGVTAIALATAAWSRPDLFDIPMPDGQPVAPGPLRLIDQILDMAWILAALALARSAMRAPEGEEWRSRLLLGTALAFLFASFDLFQLSLIGFQLDRPVSLVEAVVTVVLDIRAACIFGLIVYLVFEGARRPAKRRAATAAALAIGASGLAGTIGIGLGIAGWPGAEPFLSAVIAIAFLVEPLLVAYALLRHQLLGIDLKVKIGISRGALAAIFLAVFFVVTQVAQNYLQGYGVIVGGAAAGIMLFAIAPLQRVAERIADTAMPGVGGRRDPASRELAYKHALRFALMQGGVSRDEEMQLAQIADELGLSAQVATRLRHEVEETQRRA